MTEKMMDSPSLDDLVPRLLHRSTTEEVVSQFRRELPELLHRAAAAVAGDVDKTDYYVMCGRLARFNPSLVVHMEQWLAKFGPPWQNLASDGEPPSTKRCRVSDTVKERDEVRLLASALWLLTACPRLAETWSWDEMLGLATSECREVRFIVVECLARLMSFGEETVARLRENVVGGGGEEEVKKMVVKYNCLERCLAWDMARDVHQELAEGEKSHVVSLGHVSLTRPKKGKDGPVVENQTRLVQVPSTVVSLNYFLNATLIYSQG